MTVGELRKIMDPDNKLSEDEFKIKRLLYNKYPRPLTKKERDECKEEQERERLEELFQKKYGEEEDSDDE